MSTRYKRSQETAYYHPKQGNNFSKHQPASTIAYIPKTIKPANGESKNGFYSEKQSKIEQPNDFDSFYNGASNGKKNNHKKNHAKEQFPKEFQKKPKNQSENFANPILSTINVEVGLKNLLGVKENPQLVPKALDETSLKSTLGLTAEESYTQQVVIQEVIEAKKITPSGTGESVMLFNNQITASKQWEDFIWASLHLNNHSEDVPNQVNADKIEEFLQESLESMTFDNSAKTTEEQKIEFKDEYYRAPSVKVSICQESYSIYSKKRVFAHLLNQLSACWHDGYTTLEDEDETYDWLMNCHFDAIKSYNVFFALLFHLMVEKEYYAIALSIYQKNRSLLENDQTFGSVIKKAVKALESEGYKPRPKNKKIKIKTVFSDRMEISDLGIYPNNIHLIDRFEKDRKRIRVPAFEKISAADKIAIHYEMNKYERNYMSVITIATKEEIVIIDLERLCKYDEVLLIIIEFFEVILSRRSTVIIVFDSRDFAQKLIDSLSIEDEHKMTDIINAKIKLCQALQKYRSHYTDLSLLGFENIRDLALKVFKQDIDQREKFGNWYRRPLTEEQIKLASIDVRILFLAYSKLITEDLE